MNFIDKMVERFIKLNRRMKRWQRVVSVMAAVVVFATTYALILPAITLDRDTATAEPGIEVAASENEAGEAGTVFENTEEPAPEETAEEPEEAVAEDSGSESGSQEAEAAQAEAVAEENTSEGNTSEVAPADDSVQTEVLTTEEAATYGTTEEAIAAVTGQTAEEVKLITEDTQLTYDGSDYVVYADFGESAKLPEGVQLQVKEITKESDPEAYEMYYQKALSEMQGKYDENTTLSFAKFYDIAFVYEGVEIEPSGNVNVRIEYKQAVEIEKTTTVDTIHFDKNDEEKAEVIDSDTEGTEKEVEAVQFESDRFSVYGIVGTESISTQFKASDDNTYEVVVNYDEKAGIPEGAQLKVSEVTKDNSKYDGYVEQAAGAIDTRVIDLNYVKLLDIEILDVNGNKVDLKAPVDVQIKLLDKEQAEDTTQIVHFEGVNEKPVVVDSSVDADTVSFSTDGFSVYAVVDEGNTDEYARMNLHFMNGSTEVAMMIVKNDDTLEELETIIYDPGVGTIPEGQIFKGWSTTASYTVADAENGMNIEEVREWAEERTITENEDVYLYAMLYKNYVINYLDENNVGVGSENIFMLSTDTSSPYTVNMAYTPKDDTHAFLGWNVSEGSSNIQGYTEGTLYENGTDITITGNVTFSVNAPEGHWLIFDENGKGGTYNAPVFVESTEVTEVPSGVMTRFGYTFGGWYDTKEHADAHGANPSVTIGQFQFGNTISDRTTVYASWIPVSTANYTVLIWKQNLAGDGYDYEEAINLTGNTGTTVNTVTQQGTGNNAYARVNGTDKQYTGFHLKEYDQNVTIAPEGNAVVNIYYDRTAYTFTFQANANGNFTYNGNLDAYEASSPRTTIYTVTRLYDQDISDIWEFTGSNGVTYPETNTNTSWLPTNSSTYTARITSMQRMPAESITFRLLHTDRTTRYFHYYIETVDGETGTRQYSGRQYNLYKDLPNDFNVVYYNDDFWQLKGFTRQAITKSGNQVVRLNAGGNIAWDGRSGLNNSYGGTDNHLYFYYTRDKYSINYMDGIYVDGNGNPLDEANRGQLSTVENLYYETNLSSYNKGGSNYYNPTYSGYEFEGWYMDEACTQPYTFTTMPLDGITVYAKWRQIQYRVFLHPNADNISDLDWGSTTQTMNFRVSLGGTVSTPTGRSAEWEFVGWYTDPSCSASSLFSDDLALNESTVTAAYDKSTDFTDPMDKWGNLTGPGTNSDVDRFWITKKLDLYGKWRAKLIGAKGIKVVYTADDGNGHVGSNAPSDNNQYLDQAGATAGAASTAPEGYQFVKWVIQKWNTETNQYEDTEFSIYPGDSFSVLKNYAKYVITGYANPDNPEDISPTQDATHTEIVATYTVQLRAEYQKEGEGSPTHIHFYGNIQDKNGNAIDGVTVAPDGNEPKDVTSYNDIQINEAVDILSIGSVLNGSTLYDGYTFLGWAKSRTATEPWLKWNGTNYDILDGQQQGVLNGVTKIAADERDPYEDLYAVWERNPSYLYIVKASANEDNTYLAGAGFELYQGETKMGEATSVADAKGVKLNYALADGNYTLKETTAPNGYKGIDNDIAITVNDGEVTATDYDVVKSVDTDNNNAYTITIENTKLATVTVKKVVDSQITSDNNKDFTFTPTGLPMPQGETTFNLKHNQEKVFSDVPYGTTFSIAEMADDDFETSINATHKVNGEGDDSAMTLTGTSPDTGNITVDGDVTITYTNKRTTVDITVKKVMDSSFSDDQTWTFAFEAKLYNGETQVAFPDSVEATGVTFDNDRMVGSFTLTNAIDSLTLSKLPSGYKLVVKEVDADGAKTVANYSTTSTMGGTGEKAQGAEYTLNQITQNGTITFTNTRNKQFIKVYKHETGNESKALEGAIFTLTGPEGSGISYTGLETNADGYLVFSDSKTYIELPVNNASYTLEETKAPDGYKMITEVVNFTVSSNGVTGTGSGYSVASPETETIDGKEVTVYTVKVQNSTGVELPITGGPGTLLYTLSGIALMLGAALMYGFRMRRRERRLK